MKTSLRNWGLPNHFLPFADAKNVNVRFIHFKTLQITIQILSFYSLNCSSTWHQCYRHSLEVAVVWLFPFQNTSNTRAPPSIFVWVRTKQKHSWVSENHQFLPRCTDKHYWSAVSNVRIETKNHSSTLISLFNWYYLFWLDHFSVWLKSAMCTMFLWWQKYVLATHTHNSHVFNFKFLCPWRRLKTTRDVSTQYTLLTGTFCGCSIVVNQPQPFYLLSVAKK